MNTFCLKVTEKNIMNKEQRIKVQNISEMLRKEWLYEAKIIINNAFWAHHKFVRHFLSLPPSLRWGQGYIWSLNYHFATSALAVYSKYKIPFLLGMSSFYLTCLSSLSIHWTWSNWSLFCEAFLTNHYISPPITHKSKEPNPLLCFLCIFYDNYFYIYHTTLKMAIYISHLCISNAQQTALAQILVI